MIVYQQKGYMTMAKKDTSPLAMGRMQRGSIANKKKKKDEEEKKAVVQKRPQSSSVSKPTQQQRQNQKSYGTTQPRVTQKQPTPRARTSTQQRSVDPKEARRQESARNMRTAATRFASEDRRTAAQAQKMNMPTAEEQRRSRENMRAAGKAIGNTVRESLTDESKARMQRQKSGIQTEEDKLYNEQRNQKRIEVAKNTGRAAKKGVEDTLTGYGKTLADIDEMAKSSDKWTEAKSMKLGIDKDDTAGRAKVEEERQKSIKEARRLRLDLGEKQEKRQKEFDEATKNAKGLEKAWYGAVESGTGMATDMAVGAVTGTGQVGALASMGIRSYGTTRGQAEKEGATENEDRLYSLLQAGKEVGTEMMFQGAGLAKSAFSGGKVGLSLADRAANALTKGLTGKKADVVGAGVRLLGGTAEENAEEFAGWLADPLIKELTYGRNVRERMKESLLSNIPQVNSREEADRVASYFSTSKFTDDLVKDYTESGMSKEQAAELAEEIRDMYAAYYAGDQETLDSLSEDLAGKLSGQAGLSRQSWSLGELADTFASTTLLTLTTGIPAAASTSIKGNQIFDSPEIKEQFGENAAKKVADIVKSSSDAKLSVKADAMAQRLESGKDITGTQKYDLIQGLEQRVKESAKRAQASEGAIREEAEAQDLVPTYGLDRNGNRVFAPETEKAFNAKYAQTELTVEAVKNYMESDSSISDDEARRSDAVKKAISDLHVGALTVGDVLEFGYGNELAREALKAEEGIDLNDYIVRNSDGSIDYAATSEATEDALFKINAQNAIEAARVETEVYIDRAKGNIDRDIMSRMSSNGQSVWKSINQDLDPRNISDYLTKADSVEFFYQAGRNTDVDMNTFVTENANSGVYKNIDTNMLKRAFAAGARDRIILNTPGYGQTVKAGSNIALKNTTPILTGQLFVDPDVELTDTQQAAYLALAMSTNTNIHIKATLKSKAGVEVNGQSQGNDIYLNVNAGAEKNLGYVFMHEMTHQIKQYAPNEYMALENLVREKWFNKDANGMKRHLKSIIDLYSVKGGQTLSEEDAMEEIIADAMAEAIDDPNFAAEVCEQDLALGQAILNSIKEALRSIRAMFTGDNMRNEAFHKGLLSYLGILDEAEKMWINALATARKNKAAGLIADWQDRANEKSISGVKNSISDSDMVVEDGNARWTGERIDSLIREYGASNPDYSQAYAVMMNPRDFLKLTLSDERLEQWNAGANQEEHPEVFSLDEEELRNQEQTPFLTIYSNDGTMVQGHEGRHRMRALMEAGIKSVPVVIRDIDTKYSKVPTESMTLSSQDFGYDPVNNNATVTINDLVPIKESNRDELIQKFGGEAQVRFSVTPEQDAEYMSAVESGDMETAQRMVDEAAKSAEYDISVFHGTTGIFDVFDRDRAGGSNGMSRLGFWFTETQEGAQAWAENSWWGDNNKPHTIGAYIKLKNPKIYETTKADETTDKRLVDLRERRRTLEAENQKLLDKYGRFGTVFDYTMKMQFNNAILRRSDGVVDRESFDSEEDYQAVSKDIKAFRDTRDRIDAIQEEILKKEHADAYEQLKIDYYHAAGMKTEDALVGGLGMAIPNEREAVEKFREQLKAEGYDGIIIRNTRFDSSIFGGINTQYVVFEPEQVKSADPVTYAEDGSVIPLSERFDPTNNDIRYSMSTEDADGNVLTTNQMEYFRNSQARDEQGRLVPVYHGTFRGPRITVFNESSDGIWFTSDRSIAEDYSMGYEMGIPGAMYGDVRNPYDSDDEYFAKKGIRIEQNSNGDWVAAINRNGRDHYWGAAETKEELIDSLYESNENEELFDSQFTLRDVYPVYLNLENPKIIECNGSMHDDINGTGMTTRELAAEAMAEGYDGIIFRDVVDPFESIDVYVAFSSNQIKDTRNENPTENPDIRYSITPEDDAMEWLASQYEIDDVPLEDEQAEEGRVRMAKSKKEFIQKKNLLWNERWLTEGKILDVKSVRKGIKDVVMGAMANSDTSRQYKSDLVDKILVDAKSAYWLMKDGKHAEAAELLWDSAVKMIENVDFIEDETFKSYKDLRDYMRTTSIRLGEEYWSDVDYNAFRKRNYGRIKLVKGDTNIDQVLDDLRELAPEWFSEEAFEKNDLKADVVPDILLQMEAVLDAIQPYKIAYSSEEAESLAGDIADDLYDIVYQGSEYKSIADTFKQKYDEKTKALKARHEEAMRKAREQSEKKVDREKAKFKEYKEKNKNAKEKAKHFGNISANIDWLTNRLLNETKDKNVPEGFRKSLAHMLMQFDMQTERSKALEEKYGPAKKTLKMRELKARLDKIAKEDDTGEFRYDGYLFYLMDALADKVDGKTIDALDTEDLIVIDTMLKSIRHNFSNYNKIRLQEKQVEISEIGENTISAMDERISKYGKRKSYKGVRGMFDKLVNEGEETPIYFFERLDPTGKGIGAMYKELRRGEDKHIRNMDYLRKRFQQMFGDYFNEKKPGSELESWRDNSQSQTFNFANGSITLNPAQMMSLYCLSKRPQALGHILGAGIVSSPVTVGQKLSEQFKGETEQVESVMVTYEEVQQIIAKLTPEQIKLADEMQALMNNEMAAWGNETSLQMHGIKLFREHDYFPIKSSSEALKKTADSFDTQEKIKNFGFTKPLVRNANNAIMIDDIFSVVADHCNKMSLYNSMAIPISDFMRVYNYTQRNEDGSQKTVQQKIGEAFTRKANDYIMKFISDVNGNTKTRSDAVNDLMNKTLANYKKASIGMNGRVALQQPTAIFRALMAIDLKYFAGVKPMSRAEMNEMFEHCPIALWKSWGHYDMDMGRDIEDIMMNNDWSRWDTISMGIYGSLDNWTWGLIWQAAKNEVKAKNPSVEVGSDDFFRLVNERASEVFDKTQVVDSIFHRSDTMRSKNTLTKMATSFMAEPTLTFNVLRDSLVRANEKLKEGDPREAGKIFMKMVLVLGLNAAAVSASAAIWDAVRGKGGDDDDDKEFGELWLLNFFENLKDNVNMINNIYFVKDIYSLKDGWGTSNMALEGFETFFKGYSQLKKKITEGSDKSWYDIMMNLLGGAGYITGVPAKTIMRDVKAVFSKLGIDVFAADGTDEVSNEKAGGIVDRFLNIFRTDEEKAAAAERRIQKARDKTAEEIKDKYADLSGEERDKKVWSAVTTYFKGETEDSKAFADMVTSGDYASINAMRRVYLAAGGEAEYFDERVLAESKKALKKTLKYGQTAEEIDAQANIQSYLTSHGMTDDEVSDIIYKSDVAKDMKVAFRLGDKDLMLESLEPLVNAGLTYNDLVRLWDNRNRMDLTKYKGRYKDKLKSTGKFIWPTEGVITSHFGYRNAPTAGASSNHPAIDIGAPQGTAVVAADGGTVIYAGRNSGYGNSVGIKHDNGMVTYYNHLYSWNVKVGDTVGQGQQIAQVGSTGISTGPHLDFKILDTNGKPVDPEQYLQKRQ